jgi:glutathione S-transferase
VADIVLYQFEISPFADKVRRILHVKGVPYETRDPRITEVDAFKKKSPAGRLPVLDHNGTITADSSDIAEFLEQTYPEPALIPADPAEAGLVRLLEDWADESLYWYELTMRLTWEQNARALFGPVLSESGVPTLLQGPAIAGIVSKYGKIAAGQGTGAKPRAVLLSDVARLLDAAQGFLGPKTWMVGSGLTLADIAIYAQLACIRSTPEGAPLFEARPALSEWMGRVAAATQKPPRTLDIAAA